jgi:hypothetical protein
LISIAPTPSGPQTQGQTERPSSAAASGVAVDEKSWFNDSTDAAALAEEVAHHRSPQRERPV